VALARGVAQRPEYIFAVANEKRARLARKRREDAGVVFGGDNSGRRVWRGA
jgi:hypothetical protein